MENQNAYTGIFCATCKCEHGPLYVCKHYTPEQKALAKDNKRRFDENTASWLNEQYGALIAQKHP